MGKAPEAIPGPLGLVRRFLWQAIPYVAVVSWVGFTYSVGSDLDYPWSVVNTLLGIAAAFCLYMALVIDCRSALGLERDLADSAPARKRTPIAWWIYLAIGAVAWGIFVFNIPISSFGQVTSVLKGILGYVPLFLFLAAARLNIGNDRFLRHWILLPLPKQHETEH